MEKKLPVQSLPELTRRDFFKILSISGSALLLGGCGLRTKPAHSPTISASPPFIASPTPEPTATTTLTPSPIEIPTQTFEPLTEYLPAASGNIKMVTLPPPPFSNAMSLMQALQERHSSRNFRADELSVPLLSAILWAGFGINRRDGRRTAPSAYNVQDIAIYLITGKGMFQYIADGHTLSVLSSDDLRQYTGTQGFVAAAPANLVYVSDYGRMNATDEERLQWSWAHTGFIAQNVYLVCAALGLVTVVRSTIDRQTLGQLMGLDQNQHITLAQTIGYPAI